MKIQLCIAGINYILKYIKENHYLKTLIFQNVVCMFDQLNVALMNIRIFFFYIYITSLTDLKLLNSDMCVYIQWVRKVFRPPLIFHSLLYCSHLLKSFKFGFFSSLMYTQHPILTEKHRIVDIFADLLKKKNFRSIQTLCCDTHIFNSGAVHFF